MIPEAVAAVATDLLGEIVAVYRWDSLADPRRASQSQWRLMGRGVVRAVYAAPALTVLVEFSLGPENSRLCNAPGDLQGAWRAFTLDKVCIRREEQCRTCGRWDEPRLISRGGPDSRCCAAVPA